MDDASQAATESFEIGSIEHPALWRKFTLWLNQLRLLKTGAQSRGFGIVPCLSAPGGPRLGPGKDNRTEGYDKIMNTTLDCIPCFISHALHVASMVTEEEETREKIVRETLSIVSGMDFSQSPPEMARRIHAFIRDLTGTVDPYRDIKDESTEFALELLPVLKREIEHSDNPFETIIRLVIAGNIIDFGADNDFELDSVHEVIADSLKALLDPELVLRLKSRMEEAERILYIADNCGELVIDRLLIEKFREKTTVAVRGFPILNDATPREAELSGLSGLVEVIDTGDATPGVLYKYCSRRFRTHFDSADLIIAKGQGNYETMSEVDAPIIFLLKAKCPVVARKLAANIGSMQIIL